MGTTERAEEEMTGKKGAEAQKSSAAFLAF